MIANDTPANLKAQLGATVIEMRFADADVAQRAGGVLTGSFAGSVDVEGSMVRLSSDSGAGVLVDALRRLDAAGVEPATLSVREPSLDDVFLTLTGRHAEAGPTEGGAA